MTSIILVHTFAPHPEEHYTALPAEEGQPVSYVRRVVAEGDVPAVQDIARAGHLLRVGESIAGVYEIPGQRPPAVDLAEVNDALAKRRSKSKA